MAIQKTSPTAEHLPASIPRADYLPFTTEIWDDSVTKRVTHVRPGGPDMRLVHIVADEGGGGYVCRGNPSGRTSVPPSAALYLLIRPEVS